MPWLVAGRNVAGVLIVAVVSGVALFFSFAQALFYALFSDIGNRSRALRDLVLGRNEQFIDQRLADFWAAREIEPRAPVVTELSRLSDAVESVSGTSLFSLGFLVLFTVAIGAVNSFLLAIFFREVIGSYRVLPYPLPDLQASNLIALIIFVAEVSTGWAIYRSGDRYVRAERVKPAGAGFFAVIPWVMLGVL